MINGVRVNDMKKLVSFLRKMSFDKLVRYEDNKILIDGDLVDRLYYGDIGGREEFDVKVAELGYNYEFETSSIIIIYKD